MDKYIKKWGRDYRIGYTTGTCAAAAAFAAVEKLFFNDIKSKASVEIFLPSGEPVLISVNEVKKSDISEAEFYVIKDSGDDPDITNGTEIHVKAYLKKPEEMDLYYSYQDRKMPGIYLDAGDGVGRLSRDGLYSKKGQAAINKVPRAMIFDSVRPLVEAAHYKGSLFLLISVPGGGELAKKTLNGLLGIKGGISILGSSGIVWPMSDKAFVGSMELLIRKAHDENNDTLIFVPGKYGISYAKDLMGDRFNDYPIIQCSNFIGEALDLALSWNFRKIFLIGNIGKLCKLSAGIMNTHSDMADGRWEIFVAHSALLGIEKENLLKLKDLGTTEEMLLLIDSWGIRKVFIDSLLSEISYHLDRRLKGAMDYSVVLYSERFGRLGAINRNHFALQSSM